MVHSIHTRHTSHTHTHNSFQRIRSYYYKFCFTSLFLSVDAVAAAGAAAAQPNRQICCVSTSTSTYIVLNYTIWNEVIEINYRLTWVYSSEIFLLCCAATPSTLLSVCRSVLLHQNARVYLWCLYKQHYTLCNAHRTGTQGTHGALCCSQHNVMAMDIASRRQRGKMNSRVCIVL